MEGGSVSLGLGRVPSSVATRVLLIEDNPGDAGLVRYQLAEAESGLYDVTWVERLAAGLDRAVREEFAVLLLDLSLPDGEGIETFRRARRSLPAIPIVVLSGLNARDLALQCVREGAQDYLVKGQMESEVLQRAIGYAVERKRAADALRVSEERHRSLVDHSPIGMYSTTSDGRVLAANPALVRMLGYDSFEELAAQATADGRFGPGASRAFFRQLLAAAGEVRGYEDTWLTRDGAVIFVREHATTVRDDTGAVVSYEGTVEDVSASRRAEEDQRRLATAIEQAAEAIVITDLAGTIQYVNPVFERVTGYTRAEAIGNNPRMLKSGRQDEAFYRTLWETISAGRVWTGHMVNRRKDGSLFEEDATISPVRDATGGVVSFVAVKRDVTSEVALAGQLLQAQKMEAVGQLAGGMAHDFNNVLQAMIGQVAAIRRRSGDGELLRAVEDLERQVQRGAALTRQLLIFSRHDAAKRQRLDLGTAVNEAASMLRRLVRENVELGVDATPGVVVVHADRGQVDQVLMNLVVNAVDAMPGGGRVGVSVRRDGVWGVIAVEDSGTGVAPELRERVFEPFFTTKPAGKGTGLGLSVVHGIVTAHGGRITIGDRPGGGAVFRVSLPADELGDEGVTPSVPASDEVPLGHGQHVLLVEDEDGARQGLTEMLALLGYRATPFATAEEAEALSDLSGFDVLLTDVTLPGMTGFALARVLLARRPALKVIVMSGYAGEDAAARGFHLDAGSFLQKPFDLAALAGALAAALALLPTSPQTTRPG